MAIMEQSSTQRIAFGVERTVAHKRLYIDAPSAVLSRINDSPRAPDLQELVEKKTIQVKKMPIASRVYLNAKVPTRNRGMVQSRADRMHEIAHLIMAFHGETTEAEKDPLLRVIVGLRRGITSGLYPMEARLLLPGTVDRTLASIRADELVVTTATMIDYLPMTGTPPGTNLGGTVRDTKHAWGIWIDSSPPRGLHETSRQITSDGTALSRLEAVNLASHAQQILCFSALVGIVDAIRNPG